LIIGTVRLVGGWDLVGRANRDDAGDLWVTGRGVLTCGPPPGAPAARRRVFDGLRRGVGCGELGRRVALGSCGLR
jgi:hypothetical protein